MANVDRPNGAIAVDNLGGPVVAKMNAYNVDSSNATAIFPGDFMILQNDGNVAPYTSGGGNLIGVCAGIEVAAPTKEDGFLSDGNIGVQEYPGYLPASTAGVVYIIDSPDQLFEVQSDGTTEAVDQGTNADVTPGSGSTTTGRSAHEMSATNGTAIAQLRLIRPVKRADNDVSLANGRWVVKINEHQYQSVDLTGV